MNLNQYNKIMKDCGVCFESLSFCCNWECPNRNKAIKAVGLTKKDFLELKKEFDLRLIEKVNGIFIKLIKYDTLNRIAHFEDNLGNKISILIPFRKNKKIFYDDNIVGEEKLKIIKKYIYKHWGFFK